MKCKIFKSDCDVEWQINRWLEECEDKGRTIDLKSVSFGHMPGVLRNPDPSLAPVNQVYPIMVVVIFYEEKPSIVHDDRTVRT